MIPTPAPSAPEKLPLGSARGLHPVPEMAAVLACARSWLNPRDTSLARTSLSQQLDWDYLLTLARHSGVLPILYSCCSGELGALVAEPIRARLREDCRENLRRNLLLTQRLGQLISLLKDRGIDVIPLKGPALAEALYGNIGLRQFSDLDVLVRPQDFAAAKRVLLASGYTAGYQLTAWQEQAWFRIGSEFPFYDVESGALIEVQWRIVPAQFSLRLDPLQLWQDLENTTLGSSTCLALSPENLLLYLSVHGGKHAWNRLLWIIDVAKLLQQRRIDWQQALRLAHSAGAERLLLFGLEVAQRYAGAPLPPEVKDRVDSDRHIRKLSQTVATALLGADQSTWQIHSLGVRTREMRRDRLAYMYRTAFTPARGEWNLVRLPEALAPLYRVVRIARLLGLCFRRDPAVND